MTRLIIGLAVVLVVGLVLIGILYFSDQYRPAGPSLLDRDTQVAEEAVTKNPNLLGARLALAQDYAKAGRFPDAITQYDEILKAQPNAAGALLGRGSTLIVLNKLDAAAADFQKLVDAAKGGEMAGADPQLESAYYSLGVIAMKQNRPKDAVTQLTGAININKTDADALYLFGTALLQVGEAQQAILVTQQAVALVPVGWCEPYQQLETAYTALKDADGIQYAAGMAAFCAKRVDEAKAKLAPLTTGPHALDVLVGLGLIAEAQGDRQGAVSAYSRALVIDPKNFAATTGLGRAGGPASSSPSTSPSASPSTGS